MDEPNQNPYAPPKSESKPQAVAPSAIAIKRTPWYWRIPFAIDLLPAVGYVSICLLFVFDPVLRNQPSNDWLSFTTVAMTFYFLLFLCGCFIDGFALFGRVWALPVSYFRAVAHTGMLVWMVFGLYLLEWLFYLQHGGQPPRLTDYARLYQEPIAIVAFFWLNQIVTVVLSHRWIIKQRRLATQAAKADEETSVHSTIVANET